jgi:hypothetical protein
VQQMGLQVTMLLLVMPLLLLLSQAWSKQHLQQ